MKKVFIMALTLAISNAALAQQDGNRQLPFTTVEVTAINSPNNNPWGLVYESAITENREG